MVALIAIIVAVAFSDYEDAEVRAHQSRAHHPGLRTLATAQADFRHNDRDGDGLTNFWVRDVYGLFASCPRGAPVHPDHMLKLVDPSLAAADGKPALNAEEVPASLAIGRFKPRRYLKEGPGRAYLAPYQIVVMTHDASGRPYDDGSGRNFHRYGFCMYPVGARREEESTFIMSETIDVYKKLTRGNPVLRWPSDLAAEGWTRLD